jgi:hypothetical protein
MATKKLKMPVKFDYPLTKDKETLKRIEHNVKMTIVLFDTVQDSGVWYAQE